MQINRPDYKIHMPRNASMAVHSQAVFLVLTSVFCLGIGLFWWLGGFYLILPFAGIEVAGLCLAFRVINHHRHDYERILFQGNELVVERRCGRRFVCVRYCRYWVKLIVRRAPDGEECSLFLSQHGREMEIGIHLAADRRQALAQEISGHLIPPSSA